MPDAGTDMEARVRATLDATCVPYERVACDPALAETAKFCEHYGFPMEQSANAILVAAKKAPSQHALCMVLAPDRLDVNHAVKRKLDAGRCSFAPPELTRQVTGQMIGGVTPFGVPESLRIWVDARVMACEWIIVGGGSRSLKIKIAPEVFEHLPNVEVVVGLSKAPAPPA